MTWIHDDNFIGNGFNIVNVAEYQCVNRNSPWIAQLKDSLRSKVVKNPEWKSSNSDLELTIGWWWLAIIVLYVLSHYVQHLNIFLKRTDKKRTRRFQWPNNLGR